MVKRRLAVQRNGKRVFNRLPIVQAIGIDISAPPMYQTDRFADHSFPRKRSPEHERSLREGFRRYIYGAPQQGRQAGDVTLHAETANINGVAFPTRGILHYCVVRHHKYQAVPCAQAKDSGKWSS